MRHIPYHPLMIAIFSPLSLYWSNLYDFPIPLIELTRPLIFSIGFVVVVWMILFLKLKSLALTAVLVSTIGLTWFSYGHLYTAFEHIFLSWSAIIVLFNSLAFIAVVWVLIFRWQEKVVSISRIMNLVGLILVLNVALHIVWVFHKKNNTLEYTFPVFTTVIPSKPLPDIYYIILDGYGRDDILQSHYNYDNSLFLNQLSERGFQVLSDARSNYNQTLLHLASVLNLSHLQDFSKAVGNKTVDWNPLWNYINDNAVFRITRSAGYTTIAMASGFPFTELPNADYYLRPTYNITEFENIFLSTTPVPQLLRWFYFPTEVDQYRRALLSRLELFPDIANHSEPTFAFLHLIAPHPPFVFNEYGQSVNDNILLRHGDGSVWIRNKEERSAYRFAYINQLKFVNSQVLQLVDSIIARSTYPPIIILQADHGPGLFFDTESRESTDLDERFSIFSAMLLPDAPPDLVSSNMTSVNTFRYIFNYYLGTNLQLEPDRSYYSTISKRYQFIDITDRLIIRSINPEIK